MKLKLKNYATPVKRTFHNLHTRKSIGDKWGERSIWIVECYVNRTGKKKIWIPYWGENNSSTNRPDAVRMRNNIYSRLKKCSKKWTRKRFRVALYVRAERD